MNDLSKVKIGDKFITKAGGKVLEIRSKTRGGFKVLVMLTGKEIPVEENYIKDEVEPYVEDDNVGEFNDRVEPKQEEEPVKSVDLDEIQKSASEYQEEVLKDAGKKKPKKKRGRKPKKKVEKKPKTKKGEKKMAKKTRKETKKALILEMLKQGPQTRESLANAIIEKGLSKHNDETKEKSYASVILHTLKKEGSAVCLERGKYVLAGQEEAPAEEATEE